MKGNKCAWDQYNCTQDPNDSNYVLQTVNAMRGLGATGRVYAYGTSNGANEVQILGANSVDDAGDGQLPIVGIAARSGQMLSKPTRSGPGPLDYNQPCAGDNPCTGGLGVAQLSIHDTDDPVIPYAGGARFHSPVFILSGEEESCETWARQNRCNTTTTNATVAATTHQGGSTTANYVQWDGCPATAPVELYKVEGGSHVGTASIRGKDVMGTVFEVRARACRRSQIRSCQSLNLQDAHALIFFLLAPHLRLSCRAQHGPLERQQEQMKEAVAPAAQPPVQHQAADPRRKKSPPDSDSHVGARENLQHPKNPRTSPAPWHPFQLLNAATHACACEHAGGRAGGRASTHACMCMHAHVRACL